MSLPGEYESWMCDECPEGKTCTPIFYHCEYCSGEEDCDVCSGSGGAHVCLYAEINDET